MYINKHTKNTNKKKQEKKIETIKKNKLLWIRKIGENKTKVTKKVMKEQDRKWWIKKKKVRDR